MRHTDYLVCLRKYSLTVVKEISFSYKCIQSLHNIFWKDIFTSENNWEIRGTTGNSVYPLTFSCNFLASRHVMYSDSKNPHIWVSVSLNSSFPVCCTEKSGLFFLRKYITFYKWFKAFPRGDEKALILPSRKLCFISLFTWIPALRSVKMIFFFFCS